METRRFDELTVALARGGSRRGVLRGLVGGALGALALDRSGSLAKNEKEQGGGKPITNPAKPVCPAQSDYTNCPTCAEARFGPNLGGQGGCCEPGKGEQFCSNCGDENDLYCSSINTGNEGGSGSCLAVTCKGVRDKKGQTVYRCEYNAQEGFCGGGTPVCCTRFTHDNFGHCVASSAECKP
jgi:hypothetical protein